ncbi:CGNR zinc finger domain-containing protein [Isoptericola croceus]|nr:CGNR zinc finger domain-containing protein [Isoptericola croceus]
MFVDTSRTGRRAYCTARCGNFDAVARHRLTRTTKAGDQPGRSGTRGRR